MCYNIHLSNFTSLITDWRTDEYKKMSYSFSKIKLQTPHTILFDPLHLSMCIQLQKVCSIYTKTTKIVTVLCKITGHLSNSYFTLALLGYNINDTMAETISTTRLVLSTRFPPLIGTHWYSSKFCIWLIKSQPKYFS